MNGSPVFVQINWMKWLALQLKISTNLIIQTLLLLTLSAVCSCGPSSRRCWWTSSWASCSSPASASPWTRWPPCREAGRWADTPAWPPASCLPPSVNSYYLDIYFKKFNLISFDNVVDGRYELHADSDVYLRVPLGGSHSKGDTARN